MDVRKVSSWVLFGWGCNGNVGDYPVFFLVFLFVCLFV